VATVLIASLGDSPVVVTSMFDLLQKENKGIDRLEVFYPEESLALIGYEDLIYKSLQQKCEVDSVSLKSEDISGQDAVYEFLHELYQKLDEHQKNEDAVYLSLAGGRKSMAALMALLAPLFTCVKKLYHILDKDEGKKGHFLTTRQLCDESAANQQRLLFPPHERVHLLSIPYGEKQHLSGEVRSLLHTTITDEQLEELWERDAGQAEAVKTYKDGIPGEMMSVELTKEVAEQYRKMLRSGGIHGKRFGICFYQMRFEDYRIRNAHLDPYRYKGRTFHYYKRPHTDERPVFHIETTEGKVKKVVVSALPIEVQGRTPAYPRLEDLVKKLKFPLETEKLEDEDIPEEEGAGEAKEHILLIPLATSPMVATQLYQLYIDRGYEVHSVILVHTQHKDVRASVEIARDAFKGANVTCEAVPLEGWDDIDTPEACAAYQTLLEQTIRETQQQNPSCQIELTISGGRKGMAALATFAAQRQCIRHVVHTVIHERLNDKVIEETTVEELKRLVRTNNKKKRDDRLFLRAYKDDKDAFVLFKIPVIPARKG
jgi:CRISPR-associated Csx14 family protein